MSGAGPDWPGFRARFPALAGPGVELDNAATTHKPQAVLDALLAHYREANANVHRAGHRRARLATEAYEGARGRVARFLGRQREEVVFTRGTTEAVNLVARGYLEPRLRAGDVVVATELEHHGNLVPWQQLCARRGARLHLLPLDEQTRVVLPAALPEGTVFVTATRVSNVTGTIVDTEALLALARAAGVPLLLDLAQSIAHLPHDAATREADFVAFSAHKAYGPTGLGVLAGRRDALAEIAPVSFGGDMVVSVSAQSATFQPPLGLEAGTPPIAAAVAFVPALDLLDEAGAAALRAHELALLEQLLAGLGALPGVEVPGPRHAAERSGAVSFHVRGGDGRLLDPNVLATLLDLQGVAVRAGFHCAEPLVRKLGGPLLRASIALYSDESDINALLTALPEAIAAAD